MDEPAHAAVLVAARRTGQVELAVRALAALDGTDADHPRKLEQLREGWDSSSKFLSNVLTVLAHHGLVRSARGHRGGYWLARPLDQVLLVDLLVAVGTVPSDRERPTPHWDAVARRLHQAIEATTIADLIAEAAAAGS